MTNILPWTLDFVQHLIKQMNTAAYLQRINYHGPIEPTAETLRQLQLAHLMSVPFENLSIHWKQPIVLNDDSLFEKIVERKRGGFCYELNGLFAALLRSLGFTVGMLNARVFNSEGELGPDFDHMTLMVTLEDRWLADVGFGDSFLEPLLLDKREEQVQGARAYLIVPDETIQSSEHKPGTSRSEDSSDAQYESFILKQREGDGEWTSQYAFDLQPHKYADYEDMCHFHQTSSESHFTQNRICSRATPAGRITLSDMRFIETIGASRQERALSTDEEYTSVLREHFGIE